MEASLLRKAHDAYASGAGTNTDLGDQPAVAFGTAGRFAKAVITARRPFIAKRPVRQSLR